MKSELYMFLNYDINASNNVNKIFLCLNFFLFELCIGVNLSPIITIIAMIFVMKRK